MASRLLSSLGQAVLFLAAHAFRVVAIATDEDSSTFAAWPTITAGTAVPTEAQPNASIYLRVNGTAASIYQRTGGAWVATVGADSAASAALAALTPAADRVPYFTSASAAALATFTATGRAIVGAASVAAARAALALDTGNSPTFAQVTAALVGNVTGNVSGSSGSCTGNAATATKLAAGSYYSGVEQTGTGAEQIFAHTLGSTPSLVWASISEAPNPTVGFDIAYGAHSDTELRVTVTAGIKFFLFALK